MWSRRNNEKKRCDREKKREKKGGVIRKKWSKLSKHNNVVPWDEIRVVAHTITNLLFMFTLTISLGQTSGRCITQLAKMSIDQKIIAVTADEFRRTSLKNINNKKLTEKKQNKCGAYLPIARLLQTVTTSLASMCSTCGMVTPSFHTGFAVPVYSLSPVFCKFFVFVCPQFC